MRPRFDSGMQGQTIRFSNLNLIVILWRERRGPHGMKELKDAGSSPVAERDLFACEGSES